MNRAVVFYFSFDGRVSRKGIWFGWFLLGLPIAFLAQHLDFIAPSNEVLGMKRAELLLAIASFWPALAVFVKRLHDTNLSGWWLVPIFVIGSALGMLGMFMMKQQNDPLRLFGMMVTLGYFAFPFWLFYLRPGTRGQNRFGSDPLGSVD